MYSSTDIWQMSCRLQAVCIVDFIDYHTAQGLGSHLRSSSQLLDLAKETWNTT